MPVDAVAGIGLPAQAAAFGVLPESIQRDHFHFGHRAQDTVTGRGHVHRDGAPAGEVGQTIFPVGGRDTDQAVDREAAGIEAGGLDVHTIVARRGDEGDTGIHRSPNGLLENGHPERAPPGIVAGNDVDAALAQADEVVQALDGARQRTASLGSDELATEQFRVPVDAGDADAVVGHGGDGAGHMGAMPVVVEWIAIIVDDIDAVTVVHIAVVVVIDAVVADLSRIGPDVVGQIGMPVMDAAVDNRDDALAVAGRDVPGLGRIDVRIRLPTLLSLVVQPPEIVEERIRRRDGGELHVHVERDLVEQIALSQHIGQGHGRHAVCAHDGQRPATTTGNVLQNTHLEFGQFQSGDQVHCQSQRRGGHRVTGGDQHRERFGILDQPLELVGGQPFFESGEQTCLAGIELQKLRGRLCTPWGMDREKEKDEKQREEMQQPRLPTTDCRLHLRLPL